MSRIKDLALQNVPVILLVVVFLAFAAVDPRFLSGDTITLILRQSAYVGILAVGMTLVLMTAGIDLSVGSLLYLTAVVVGQIVHTIAMPIFVVPLLAVLIGALFGAFNGFAVSVLKIIPFIVTLAMLTAFRGLGYGVSDSREVNYPDAITALGAQSVLGIPLPIVVFALVVLLAHVTVTRTPFGRQLLATGEDKQAAARAGVKVGRIQFTVYVISGALVGLASFVAVIQQFSGTVTPAAGKGIEFDAIAAAVLGGTSLFGGRGSVFPGTVVGTLLIQLVNTGLGFVRVDLYLTQMVQAGIILLAVLIDSIRTGRLEKLRRTVITSGRQEADADPDPARTPSPGAGEPVR